MQEAITIIVLYIYMYIYIHTYGLDDPTYVRPLGVAIWSYLHPSISTALMRPRRPKQYCLQLHTYIYMRMSIYTHIFTYMYVCIYVYVYMCVYIYLYIYLYTSIYIYTHTYTYINNVCSYNVPCLAL